MALVAADREAMFSNQEPISKAIGLEEAMARAVKYNLQERLALMEKLAEENVLDLQHFDMLPKVAANAGWTTRDSESASSSKSVSTGAQSLESSTSQDKSVSTADLSVSWNILDFGIGYFGSKAQANNILAAEERRRSVVADIIQKVRSAYWDAVTAQQLQPVVKATLQEAYDALEKAKQTEKERLIAPLDALKYQKSLLEMISRLETLEGDLSASKARLAALMNLPPATRYQLVEEKVLPTSLHYSLEDLEAMAMVNRPEINEEAYRARNVALDTRSALMRLLPGASLFVGSHYSSNSYLANNDWADAGVQVSWNLLNVFSYSDIKRLGETKQSVADLRRQALRMAVLTQVNIAWQQYSQANNQFERTSELLRVQNAILKQTSGAYQNNAQSLVERVRMTTESVLATRSRDRSFAQMQNAYGAIFQAAGLDPLPEQVADHSVETLTQAISAQSRLLDEGQVADLSSLPASQLASLNVPVDTNLLRPVVNQVNKNINAQDAWQSLGSLQEVQMKDYTYQ
ncbi:TolC family protein [Marinomonas sp. C1424]|uniref:TolC family protein n=2 Tax=Marinomonas transparens TaxID=2795388 RepID=A0A934MUN8_9GAMM|nr:TolC family protein [Marinomonas transparens]